MSEIKIREYQPEDRLAIEQSILEIQEDEYGRRPHFWVAPSPEVATILLDHLLKETKEEAEMKMYIGVLDGEVAGWISVQAVKTKGPEVALKKYGYINELVVLRKYHRKGVGIALMNKAETFIKSLRLEWMGLNTNPHNPALDFYKKLGYNEGSIRLEKKLI